MRHVTDCHVERLESGADPSRLERADSVYLGIAGMECPHCANRVRNALLRTPGVVEVEVQLPGSIAQVWFDRGAVSLEVLVDTVRAAGKGTHHDYLAIPVRSRF